MALCGALVLATAGAAHADEVVGAVSSVDLHAPDNAGDMQRIGRGGGASLLWLCRCDDATVGIELSTLFLAGSQDERVYDLGFGTVLSFGLRDKPLAVPYITLGIDVSAVSVADAPGSRGHGVSMGVHGGGGLHGYLGDELYWRAQVGYLGAGIQGITGALTLGYVFGKDL